MIQTLTGKGLRVIAGFFLAVFFLFSGWVTPAAAQSLFTSLGSGIPIDGIERYIGPIFPKGGIGSTFRSETGTGVGAAQVESAKLVGQFPLANGVEKELNLRKVMPLDGGPHRYDLYTNLRFWRFGLRASYSNFETRSIAANQGKYDFSGLTVGGDFDLVQLQWLTVGIGGDYHFYNPTFRGTILGGDGHLRLPLKQPFSVELKGERPSTIGPYIRQVPPEILGFPVHLEAYLKLPLQGSKLLQYGFALSFRPQIYRFDLAAKLGLGKTHLKFDTEPQFVLVTLDSGTEMWQIDKIDMEWGFFTAEVAVYF